MQIHGPSIPLPGSSCPHVCGWGYTGAPYISSCFLITLHAGRRVKPMLQHFWSQPPPALANSNAAAPVTNVRAV